jgi:hypothetical protein
MDEAGDRRDHAPWPARAVLLAALGCACGFLFHQLTSGGESDSNAAFVTLVAVFGAVFAFALERLRWQWSLLFAAGGALICAFVAWWNGQPGGWGADEGWQFAACLAAVAIAVPLFQSARDEERLRLVPAAVHAHAWTNIILWGAACAFVGATMLLTFLLAELFGLIGVHFLRDLLRDGWFAPTLACAAFGGAIGLLRDRDVVTSVLQRVGRTILSVLAPVLAAGLVFFVLALPFTGLDALWEQTKETTPIVLACMFGALILANAVAGNSAEEEARAPVLRWSAMALAATMVPLAAVGALSTGQRIAQYGFTPDRLWAAVFVTVAGAVALGYAWALFRGRSAWPAALRETNVRLAAGVCLLALFLALPIVSFGALSARDQVARLESGKISPAEFDWRALRFDFGPAGRRALQRLAAAGPHKGLAANALSARNPWDIPEPEVAPVRPVRIRVEGGPAIPPELMPTITASRRCISETQVCRLVLLGPSQAILISAPCPKCSPFPMVLQRGPGGRWSDRAMPEAAPPMSPDEERRMMETGKAELRTVERQQLFVDGKPVGEVFR